MTSTNMQQQFVDTMNDCRRIYVDNAIKSATGHADGCSFINHVEDSFTLLLVKVIVEVAWADFIWSNGEVSIARTMAEELLRERVGDRDLHKLLDRMVAMANAKSWQALLEPLMSLQLGKELKADMEFALIRMANIVAKVDGNVTAEVLGQLKNLQWQLHQFLGEPSEAVHNTNGDYSTYGSFQGSERVANIHIADSISVNSVATQVEEESAPAVTTLKGTNQPEGESLEDVMAELNALIGVDSIKGEVQGLVNFLKVQAHRVEAGLPENNISLHMVFEGNPGTGKTTVARLVGRIFSAIGVLKKGHLIETDRSGLVAQFAGQTAPKTNEIIDRALDGVLFIDEAYSLMNEEGKDAFGAEAIQTLLKRAEDDRDRLIVILAGYCEPMQQMLQSNPGLSSRFSRHFVFPDYQVDELSDIFQLMADSNHYRVTAAVKSRLLEVLSDAVQEKDEHFGNGRLMRNIFETAMRRLADRVVDMTTITPEILTTFEAADIVAAPRSNGI